MRIIILLKEIRNKKRIEFRAVIEINRYIKFAFKLYRKEWKRAYNISISAYCTSFKCKGRRFIQSNTISIAFIFYKTNSIFHKISTIVDDPHYIY